MNRAKEGKFLYARWNNTCVIKPIGKVTYLISPALDAFLQKAFTDSSISSFLIDLTETTYIDSTNLGLFARVRDFSSRQFNEKPTLISTNEMVNDALLSLGFDRIFNVVRDITSHGTGNLEEVPEASSDTQKLEAVMLKAHRYLAELRPENREMFRDVITFLQRDSQAEDGENKEDNEENGPESAE
jgi:anti-anti-sigma factor